MSEDVSPADDPHNSGENLIKIDEKFLIKLTNENNKIIDQNVKQNFKILQISSELDIDQKLAIISTLEPSEYPNLFIFIIEHENGNFINDNQGTKSQQLDEHLKKFGAARPLIIQQICEAENKTKFYYKAENSSEIVDIDQHCPLDYELYENWKNTLSSYLEQEFQPFEDEMFKKLSYIKDSSIILRFLRTLNLPEAIFGSLVLQIAQNGSKAELLAILDASYENNGRILNNRAQNYIKYVFKADESGSESTKTSDDDQMEIESDLKDSLDEDQDDPMEVESTLQESSEECQDDPMEVESLLEEPSVDDQLDETSSKVNNEDSSQSILLTAIQHSNQEIIDFLVTYWTPLIQQLPVEHQIRISTAAYDTNQLNVLCDLLKLSDFPFPDDFSTNENQVNHERLHQITNERSQLEVAIYKEDFEEIDGFINNNQNLKFIYNIDNISVLTQAAFLKKFGIFYYLKSLGFQGERCQDILENLDQEEKKKAVKQATEQRKTNIDKSLLDFHKSVWHLSARSLIHNRKISKELEAEYRSKIRSWLKDIQKIAPEMLEVTASCEDLKIIYDFESHSVENVSLENSNSSGSTNTRNKWIFIGAKFTDKAREQEIKGVLAHELCHYVMGMVYENQEFPYYKGDKRTEEVFKEIVSVIDKWSITKEREPDDECNGIISTVYRLYKSKDYEPELIVRVVQILTHYDDDPEKLNLLQEIYQILFDFWYKHVVPEMQNYFKKDKVAIRINTTVELLSRLSDSEIEFSVSKDMEQLTENKVTIVTTNMPTLLFININKYLQEKCGSLLDSQNVFIEPEKIKNKQVWKDLKDLHARDVKLNIFVDCTKGRLDNISSVLSIEEFKFIFVASNEEQAAKLRRICNKNRIKSTNVDIKYNWSNLTEESQTMLLKNKLTFQTNPKTSLIEILSKNTNPDQTEVKKIIVDFSNIINDYFFNLLIDRENISINSNVNDSKSKNFEILFQKRNFLKKDDLYRSKISQEELISISINNKHVLISDIAGSGKSWVVKNISALIMKQDPTRWVTYVDLKQFIEKFRKQPENLEFADYFIENILKPKTKFEEEIFKKLYKIGKVSIIFDAFDEIAPDCAAFVADLAKLFEFNDGNQLWIITRDYFEVNLQKKLQIDNVYNLSEFTEKDGINFIVASWILTDLKDQKMNKFEECLQNSPNLSKYQEKAFKIVQKVTMSSNKSIGLPQLFSMIADEFKDDKELLNDLKRSKIFTQFVNTMYTRWADFKGILRKEASVQSQDYELNFKELHQYCALLSLFPELVDILFPDYDISEWPETEIIAGGFLNKIGSSYSFNHETFREYFVADFIFKAIKKPKIKKAINELLIKVLTIRKFGIIRMFLNDFIESSSIIKKVQLELEKSVKKFNDMENLSEYFTENLEHLATCVIEILKKGDYDKIKMILSNNVKDIASKTKDLNIFSMFTEFLFSYLSDKDLKDMINSQNILHKIIGSSLDAEIVEHFVLKLEEKADREFIQQELKLMPSGPENGNIFYHLGTSQNLSENKVKKCFEMFQKHLDDSKIVELMEKCTEDQKTILKILVKKPMNYKPFFDGAEYFFANQNVFQKFKNIVRKPDSYGLNILHWNTYEKDIDFYKSLWKLIQKAFENQDELGTFVLQKNKSQTDYFLYNIMDIEFKNNTLHFQIIENKVNVIEFTLNKLKEILSESDYLEILRSKGQFESNLLHLAAVHSEEVKTHQLLWKKLQESCKSNQEFLEILGEFDEKGSDVFIVAASFATSEVFSCMEEELAKFASRDEVRKLFTRLGPRKINLLQAAAENTERFTCLKNVWKILPKYFSSAEILEFIKNLDIYGNNLLIDCARNKTEIAEFTWDKVKELLKNNDVITEEHKDNIQKCEKIIKSICRKNYQKSDEIEILKLKWIKNENSKPSKLFYEEVKKNLIDTKSENLQYVVNEEIVTKHHEMWTKFIIKNANRANLNRLSKHDERYKPDKRQELSWGRRPHPRCLTGEIHCKIGKRMEFRTSIYKRNVCRLDAASYFYSLNS